MGGLSRLIANPDKEPARKETQPGRRGPESVRSFRASAGPAQQAGPAVEPRVPAGARLGAGRGPAVLLRALHRPRRRAVPVHGRRAGGGGDGDPHVHGRGAPVPPVAAVPAGIRVEGVAGGGMREARVGRARGGVALRQVAQGVLVRRLRHTAGSTG